MSNLRIRWVFRRDEIQRHFRLARVLWERGEPGKPGGGYSAKLSVAVEKRLYRFERDVTHDWLLTLFGVRLGFSRSFGGIWA